MILQAAIKKDDVTYTLPSPARHSDVMRLAGLFKDVNDLERYVLAVSEQGFLDSRRGFVNRSAAASIASAEGQIVRPKYQPNQLFSEDLW